MIGQVYTGIECGLQHFDGAHLVTIAFYMEKQRDYADFINRSPGGRLVLLELGVGFNTPSIIRWPFERITTQHPQAALIRNNLDDVRVPGEIAAKSIEFQQDIAQVIQALVDWDHDSGTCLAGRNRPSLNQPFSSPLVRCKDVVRAPLERLLTAAETREKGE